MSTITKRRAILGLLMSVGAASLLPTGALAQVADTQEVASDDGTQDIIVTARKQNESILRAPLAIAALNADDLKARDIKGYANLNSFVPNFRFQELGSASNARSYFTITTRGIFPGSAAPERQATSIFLDGVPIGGGGTIAGLTDIAQVEVVNGPQSAYFGRSTFSGAVNFVTRAPGDQLRITASAEVVDYGGYELQTSVEGGIVPGVLAARVSARAFRRGGQYENFGFGGKLGAQATRSAALSLSFTPADAIRVRAYLTGWRDRDGPAATGLLYAPDYNCNAGATPGGPFNYICGEIKSVPADRISMNTNVAPSVIASLQNGNRVTGSDFFGSFGLKRNGYQGYVSADIDLPWGVLLSGNYARSSNQWTSIADNGNRFTPAQNATFLIPYDIFSESAEVRLASPRENRLRVLAGANWFKQRTFAGNGANRNGVYAAASQYNLASTDTLGFFGSAAFDLNQQVTLSLEGRAQRDRVRQDVIATPGVDADGTTWSFTPRAIVQFKASKNVEIYGSYAQGTRPVQFNTNVFTLPAAAQAQILAQAPVQLKVDEEKLSMWEVGLKGDFFDRRLRILAAGYYGDWSDRQIQVLLPYSLAGGFSTATVILPNGQVELYGFELQARFRASRALTLEGTYGYAETSIGNTSCTDCSRITGNTNPVGNRLQRYPAVTASASASYERRAFGDFDGYGRVDYIYTGKQYETEANVAWLAPANRVNLRAGLRSDSYRIELFVTNLFDNKTPVGLNRVADTYNSSNNIVLAPPERRLIGASFSLTY